MTDLIAATASTERGPGWTILAVLLLAAALTYVASCWWWPFTRCSKCKGLGRISRKDGKVFRPCPRCQFTGRRLRVGRRLYNAIRSRQQDAS